MFDVDGQQTAFDGDLIVGADGIHSTARDALVREAVPPHWNGSLMWRGATDWPTYLTGSSMIVAGGNRRRWSSTRSPPVGHEAVG